MFKKIAIIVLFLGVTAGMAYLLYRFFFVSPPGTVPPPTGNEVIPGGGLPPAGPGQPGGPGVPPPPGGLPTAPSVPTIAAGGDVATPRITDDVVLSLQSGANGLQYYNVNDGKFYRVLPSGTTQTLSTKTFPQAESVDWAPTGNKALLTFPDQSKIIYDFATQQQVTIPNHWQDIEFNADGSQIVAKSMGLSPENRWLVMAASDGSSQRLIEPLGENGDKVTISVSPDESVVAFSATADPVGFDSRDLLVIGQNHENFAALRVEGFGFEPNWAPDGSRLLYSVSGQTSDYEPSLWIVDGTDSTLGASRRNLGIHTWADKCTFQSSATAYCAVPENLPEGAGLERAIADTIADRVFKIDLATGSALLIGNPEEATSIKSLTLSTDGSRLYFLSADGALKEMRLR